MAPTLLIIDDNPSVRDSLRFLFMRRGYAVFVAENGPKGIAIAAESRIDGALVDVNMPEMNGVEVCRLLREQATARGQNIVIWMMTGARTVELTRRALEAGALALLGKPFDFAELFRQFDEKLGPPAPLPKPPDVLDEL
ncbi:MAG TPA: response regulator [Opitutaceae bacterium]|nr:response regulator [Opitutaceae bacterium]